MHFSFNKPQQPVNNMAAAEEKSPLLAEEGGVRSRRKAEKKVEQEEEKWEASKDPTWNPDLPYGGRVYLAKKGKPDPWWVTTLEVRIIYELGRKSTSTQFIAVVCAIVLVY